MFRWLIPISLMLVAPLFAGETVVCVHGLFSREYCMRKFERAFHEQGYRTVNWGYRACSNTIEEHAEEFVKVLQGIAKKHPGDPISFVTHSLGGIIARAAVSHPACPREAMIGSVVQIAPPNQGAVLGRKIGHLGIKNLGIGMQSGVQLLEAEPGDFDRFGEFTDSMDVLIIAGTRAINPLLVEGQNDGVVMVLETLLSRPHDLLVIQSGHLIIKIDPRVVRAAVSYIAKSSDKRRSGELTGSLAFSPKAE